MGVLKRPCGGSGAAGARPPCSQEGLGRSARREPPCTACRAKASRQHQGSRLGVLELLQGQGRPHSLGGAPALSFRRRGACWDIGSGKGLLGGSAQWNRAIVTGSPQESRHRKAARAAMDICSQVYAPLLCRKKAPRGAQSNRGIGRSPWQIPKPREARESQVC